MTREKLARLIWKLWKRRNYYKYWYEYELQERGVWMNLLDDMNEKMKEAKKDKDGT
jgi:hypothetical protein